MKKIAFVFATAILALAVPCFCSAQNSSIQADHETKFKSLGFKLMPVGKPGAIYRRVVVVGNLAYTSGHIAISADGQIMTGKLGDGISLEIGQKAAQRSAVAMLSSLKAELGSLNRIKRLVKTTGMVNCTPEFTDQSLVVNGFSQVFLDLLGEENGVGARSAVGMSSLPRGTIIEVEAIFELYKE